MRAAGGREGQQEQHHCHHQQQRSSAAASPPPSARRRHRPPPSARRRQPVCCCSRLRRRRPPPQCPRARGQNQSYIHEPVLQSVQDLHDSVARSAGVRAGALMLPVRIPVVVSSRSDADRARVRLRQDETRREVEANVDVFAAAAAPRPPVCFGADAAPSLAARDGAAAASAPRSTALQQRAVQSGYRHDSWRRRHRCAQKSARPTHNNIGRGNHYVV